MIDPNDDLAIPKRISPIPVLDPENEDVEEDMKELEKLIDLQDENKEGENTQV